MRNDISDLQKQSQTLKDTLTDMQAKSIINNLIIGGLDEVEEGMAEDVEHTVRSFMLDDLKIPRERIVEIKFERVQRTGLRTLNRYRKVLAVFSDTKDKTYVKTFRKHLENTDKFMHDQYPPEIVAYRKKLIPFMKLAKDDGKDAYIKYNRLIVNGEVYKDGVYGKIPV